MRKVELLCLAALLLFLGTGLYTRLPGAAYAPVAGATALLFLNRRFLRAPYRYLEPNMLIGGLIFNIFLLLQIILNRLEVETYIFQAIAVNSMLLIYIYTKLVLSDGQTDCLRTYRYLGRLLICGLLLLLLGQVAQIVGFLDYVNFESDDKTVLIAKARPGGFLNPNVTAAIAVTFIFALDLLSKVTNRFYIMTGLLIGIAIVALAQSRAALLALLIFILMYLAKNSLRSNALAFLVLLVFAHIIFIAYPHEASLLISNFLQRFEGDAGSDERQEVLRYSFEAIGGAPIWGNGSMYLVKAFGASSHNQIVESLVSYGFVGFLVIGVVFVLLYLPIKISLVMCCIFPMLLFSHNFFDSGAYQVALGLTMAISRVIDSNAGPRSIRWKLFYKSSGYKPSI